MSTPRSPSRRRTHRPIFIVAFTRGGSNILLNLLRSHPDVVAVRGELQQVFRGAGEEPVWTRLAKRLRYLPILLGERRHVLGVGDWSERGPFGRLTAGTLDRVLHDEPLRARSASENRYISESVEYSREQIARARPVVKNVDGLIMLSRHLARVFPDATFVGLVRNGYAVCEGQVRRGVPLEHAARHYALGVQRMEEDARELKRFALLRYEDLIDPASDTLIRLLDHCELADDRLDRIRLETKAVMSATGEHSLEHHSQAASARAGKRSTGTKRLVWYEREAYMHHFVADANTHQIARLTREQIALVRSIAGSEMDRHDYPPPRESIPSR